MGRAGIAAAPQKDRDAIRASQAHSQARPSAFTRADRRTRRVHPRSHRPEPSEDGQAGPDAQARIETGKASARVITTIYCSPFSTKSARLRHAVGDCECPLFGVDQKQPDGSQTTLMTRLYGPAVRCKLNLQSGSAGLALLYPALAWSRSLLAIMDIRARPISFSDRPSKASWVTRSRTRRRDRSSIFLKFNSQTSASTTKRLND